MDLRASLLDKVESCPFKKVSISIADTKIDIAHTDEILLAEIALGYFTASDKHSVADYTIYLIPSNDLSTARQRNLISKLIGFSRTANGFYDSSQGSFVVELTNEKAFFIIYGVNDCLALEPKFFHMPFGRIANALDLVPIHASCMLIDGKGILAVGRSGSGKSSIVSAAVTSGIKILGDDILWAGIVSEKVTIYATSKTIKLLHVQPSFKSMTRENPHTNERGKRLYYLKSQFEHLFIPKAIATHAFTLSLSSKSQIEASNKSSFLQNFMPSTITMFSDPKMAISLCKSLANLLSLQSLMLENRNEVNLRTLISFLRA